MAGFQGCGNKICPKKFSKSCFVFDSSRKPCLWGSKSCLKDLQRICYWIWRLPWPLKHPHLSVPKTLRFSQRPKLFLRLFCDYSAIFSARFLVRFFLRSSGDFYGKTCNVALRDSKTQRCFCDCDFFGTLRPTPTATTTHQNTNLPISSQTSPRTNLEIPMFTVLGANLGTLEDLVRPNRGTKIHLNYLFYLDSEMWFPNWVIGSPPAKSQEVIKEVVMR